MDFIPTSAPHWHLLLNHFPSIGTVVALGLLVAALYLRSEDLNRASLVLFVLLALISIPTFVSGGAARAALEGAEGIESPLLSAHQDAATLALVALLLTGLVAWLVLWQYRRHGFGRAYSWGVPAVLVLGLVSLALMVRTGRLGGHINHAEIRSGEELAAAAANPSWTADFSRWVMSTSAPAWPTIEAAHFIGMAMLFGVVLLVTLRVLGVIRHIPFNAFHRLLPLGVLGFVINVATGMMFFTVDYSRYATMTNSFFPKMALIVVGGVAILYFTIFAKPWALQRGEDAPVGAKLVAVVTVLAWSAIIVYGRLLPYLEGTGG